MKLKTILPLTILAGLVILSAIISPLELSRPAPGTIRTPRHLGPRLRQLAVIAPTDIHWTPYLDTRVLEINDLITPQDFARISQQILNSQEMDLHGSRFGHLPSRFFGSVQLFLVPVTRGSDQWVGITLRVDRPYDPLAIGTYRIYLDAYTANHFILVVRANTGITDQQIRTQFARYWREVLHNV